MDDCEDVLELFEAALEIVKGFSSSLRVYMNDRKEKT